MQTVLPKRDVVLLGVGHTNAHVLRMWKMRPIENARLTCVSNFGAATYSGMLPGVLAGQYPPERMEIDLVRLCAANGARLVVGEVVGLGVENRRLVLADRPPLPFDVLSIGIGSVPKSAGVEADETLMAIKPMQTFLPRLEARLAQLAEQRKDQPLRVAVVGAGAGGVEIAFCLPARVRKLLGNVVLELTIIDAHQSLVGGARVKTSARAQHILQARGVNVVLGRRVESVHEGRATLDDGQCIAVDLVLWAASAAAPPLLAQFDLPKDDRGFLLTHSTLQTTAGAPIFAVGDTGTIENSRTPKAGVYAVRQGMILWKNIRRHLDGRPLVDYQPQQGFLKLLNTGDGKALGEYKGFSFSGSWCWKLKDAIDGRFMDKYQDYTPMEMKASANEAPMRCAGCGGKLGGSVLSRVLARLEIPPSEHVLLGLETPDDAAIVAPPGGRPITVTADFFAAPLDDPYLVGRIAALNAASDVFALGARPLAALAMAAIPVGPPRQQEQLLYELLAGALREFRAMDATLVGGHTIEGPQLTAGFTLLADQGDRPPLTKSSLRAGDCLVLTKPLGTGALLAAQMQARCRAAWMETLLASMLLSNAPGAALVDEFDITGVTDITGFGLAGHLLEMLSASNLAANINLADVPLLPGAAELFQEGVESTLAPANAEAEAEIKAAVSNQSLPQYRALFDPQTSGGLLLGVAERDVEAVLARLSEQSDVDAAMIGRAVDHAPQTPRIALS